MRKNLLNAREAAELIGIPAQTFYRLRRAGELPLKPAVGKYYARAELDKWLEFGCPDSARWEKIRRGGEDE